MGDDFQIKSWRSLTAMVFVAMIFISAFSWAIRLDERVERYASVQAAMREHTLAEIASVKVQVDRASITEARVTRLERDFTDLRDYVRKYTQTNNNRGDL